MQTTRTFPLSFALLLALCAGFTGPGAWAEKADKNKPLNAEADALRYDDLKQTSAFSGNVVITKGSIILRGASATVRQDSEGFQYGSLTETSGKRAFFRQKREGLNEWIEGEAETIYYDGKADTVTFTKNAVLRRYKGTALNDETTGSQITYDNLTDVFNVVGGPANASATNPSGRIRIMMTPQAAAPAAEPRNTAPPATLRPSTTVGGERK